MRPWGPEVDAGAPLGDLLVPLWCMVSFLCVETSGPAVRETVSPGGVGRLLVTHSHLESVSDQQESGVEPAGVEPARQEHCQA